MGMWRITRHLGTLSTNSSGWSVELNKVIWADNPEKYDLRSWSPDHKYCGKGVTFSKNELIALKTILNKRKLNEDEEIGPEDLLSKLLQKQEKLIKYISSRLAELEENKEKEEKREQKRVQNRERKRLKALFASIPPATNSNFIEELILSMFETSNMLKEVYTAYEIKEYLLLANNTNAGELITRELLVQVCGDLYKQQHKYYIVEGNENSLQLVRVKDSAEWKRRGFGSVFNPKLTINDKEYDVKNFVLYVFDLLNNVKCVKQREHQKENVTINTSDVFGNPVKLNAFFCSGCGRYFTTKDVIEKHFYLKNRPFLKYKFCGQNNFERRAESELMLYGYNVRADGMDAYERQNLLARLMTYGFLEKVTIVRILKDHINFNGRAENMEKAVERWTDDLEFVQNYNIDAQKTIKPQDMQMIYAGRKNSTTLR